MGIDYYSCENCGDSFSDYGYYVSCECGNRWCSDECASEDKYIKYNEDDIEVIESGIYSSCAYCRDEDFSDNEVINHLLKKHNTTRQEVIEEIKLAKKKENEEE